MNSNLIFDQIFGYIQQFIKLSYNKSGQISALKIVSIASILYLLSFPVFNYSFLYMIQDFWRHELFGHKSNIFGYWPVIKTQSIAPLQFIKYGYLSHASKMVFRLVLPLLYNFFSQFQLNAIIAINLLQILLGFIHLILFWKIICSVIKDKLIQFFLLVTYINTYVGSSSVLDVFGNGDAYAYFFMIAAIYFRGNIFSLIFLTLSYWTDERALINSTLVLFCWILLANQHINFKANYNKNLRLLITLVASWLIYLAGRLILLYYFHFETAMEGSILIAFKAFCIAYFRIFPAFESFWIIILLAAFGLISKKKYYLLFLLTALMAGGLLVSFMITDHTRSICYTFPIIFISIILLKENFEYRDLKILSFVMAVVNILCPIFLP